MSRETLAEMLRMDLEDPLTILAEELADADADLSASLRAARIAAGMTQDEVAQKMGCDLMTVGEIESFGGDPRLSTIRLYALVVRAKVTHAVTAP